MDTLGIEWSVSAGDFFLPRLDCYLTVSVNGLDSVMKSAAVRLSKETGQYVYLFFGEPWFNEGLAYYPTSEPGEIAEVAEQSWTQCPLAESS